MEYEWTVGGVKLSDHFYGLLKRLPGADKETLVDRKSVV